MPGKSAQSTTEAAQCHFFWRANNSGWDRSYVSHIARDARECANTSAIFSSGLPFLRLAPVIMSTDAQLVACVDSIGVQIVAGDQVRDLLEDALQVLDIVLNKIQIRI